MFKNYVKEYLDSGKSLEDLKSEFGIDTREVNHLVIFSYSQIDSPKTDPIVRMCRGLVLEKDTWNIVNFPFYRFYNFEEVPAERVKFNWDKAVATTKVDGSLVCVWNYNGQWNISTRSCIGGENQINDFGVTFNDLFDEAIKPFTREQFFNTLNNSWCYMFEQVSPMNQIVTPYEQTKLYCLGARTVGKDQPLELNMDYVYNYHNLTWNNVILKPEIIPLCNDDGSFKGFDEMKDLAESVGAKDEGFVVVDYSTIDPESQSFPRVKVKNSAYVALHHLRGSLENGQLNFGGLLNVIYKGEQDEVKASLPHFTKYLDELEIKWNNFCQEFSNVISKDCFTEFWKMSENDRKDPVNKKNFALNVMNNENKKFSPYLFLMFNKNLTSLKQCIEFDKNRDIKDKLKDIFEKYLN